MRVNRNTYIIYLLLLQAVFYHINAISQARVCLFFVNLTTHILSN